MNTTRLHKACRNGKLEEIKMLLQDENWFSLINSKVGTFGYTPLHEAVYARKHDVVKLLLDLGADVNSRSDKNYTALHIAASLDARDCIEVLLEYNANTSLIDDFNKTPYETAKQNNRGFSCCLIFSADVLNSLKQCRNEEFLNYLKNIKPEDVTLDCFEKCLKVAIDQDNCTAAGVLMLLKPRNVKSCLDSALKKQCCYKSTLLLLLCYVIEKHNNDVLKLICESNCSENIEFDQYEWSDLQIPTSLLYLLRSYMIEIKEYFVYPIRIGCSPLVKNYEGIQFILSNFFCDKKKLVANWGNLSLPCFHEEWQKVCMVIKLKNVILSFNCIESISSNKITIYLKSVQRLNLSSNNLKEIPPDLLKLPMLHNLNLSSNNLKHLPDVKEWSQYFTTLSLDNNLLESFPTNVEQVPIKHLYISNNKLASIPEGICNLKYLETLKICGNVNIHALPLNMGNLTKLTLLDKAGLKINSPPAIKNLNKTEDIMRYLIALKRAAEPYYTMKLMIVGFEAQGKTTLLKRLQDNTSYNENQPTEGMLKILFMESTSVIQCVVNILSI
ncbi:uncharacterized protein LOC136083632 [Hydra vulgaris]|uniref:Uncharacterized protein LOC136083632 n=1 Tax=Hydra vulgaris TaxID=6087 RepID=A0ABM4CBY0_HYDVU